MNYDFASIVGLIGLAVLMGARWGWEARKACGLIALHEGPEPVSEDELARLDRIAETGEIRWDADQKISREKLDEYLDIGVLELCWVGPVTFSGGVRALYFVRKTDTEDRNQFYLLCYPAEQVVGDEEF